MAKFDDFSILGELRDIANSSALKVVLEERRAHFQEEVNRFVNEQNLIEAYSALKRMNDTVKFIAIIEGKINQIQKEIDNGKR